MVELGVVMEETKTILLFAGADEKEAQEKVDLWEQTGAKTWEEELPFPWK